MFHLYVQSHIKWLLYMLCMITLHIRSVYMFCSTAHCQWQTRVPATSWCPKIFLYICTFLPTVAGSVCQAEAYLEQTTNVPLQVAPYASPLDKTTSSSRTSSGSYQPDNLTHGTAVACSTREVPGIQILWTANAQSSSQWSCIWNLQDNEKRHTNLYPPTHWPPCGMQLLQKT